MNNKNIILNQKGFSVAEISVAILLLIIFVSLIVTLFNNVYLSFVNSKRNSIATLYATQISEKIETMLYEEVTTNNLRKDAYLQDLDIQDGYNLNIQITPNTENTVKRIEIEISYILGNVNNIKKVNIQKTKTRENETIPNKPELYTGMVPVKYDTYSKCWVVTSEEQNNWYNYYNNQWANVMLLDGLTIEGGIQVTEDNKAELVGSKVLTPGSMFVWIPRYAYKVIENQDEIEIVFLYATSSKYVDNTINSVVKDVNNDTGYVIPESFQEQSSVNEQDSIPIKGFWVSKYPAGYQQSTININEYEQEVAPTLNLSAIQYSDINYSSCNLEYTTNALEQDLSSTQYSNQRISYPVFKSMTYAYNLININDAKNISRKISESNTFYGLNGYEVNSRLTSNSDWNAIVYLANSKYGNTQMIQNLKNLNNSNEHIYSVTGYSNANTANDVECSSTNNMSGIFDLKGCIWEHTYDSNNYYKRGGSNTENASLANSISSGGEPNINIGFRVILTEK